MTTAIVVRDATSGDVPVITDLFNQYIGTRTTEWTERPHTVEGRRRWLETRRDGGWPVLVAKCDDDVVGVATYGDFRDSAEREGYRFTVEHSVHVADGVQGQGCGRALMEALIDRARRAGLHVMVGAIDGDNPDSIRFHERMGFVEVGRLPEVGYKFDRWLSLVFVQLVL